VEQNPLFYRGEQEEINHQESGRKISPRRKIIQKTKEKAFKDREGKWFLHKQSLQKEKKGGLPTGKR